MVTAGVEGKVKISLLYMLVAGRVSDCGVYAAWSLSVSPTDRPINLAQYRYQAMVPTAMETSLALVAATAPFMVEKRDECSTVLPVILELLANMPSAQKPDVVATLEPWTRAGNVCARLQVTNANLDRDIGSADTFFVACLAERGS
ncbi:hypothetical protein EYC84_010302 [Monilinia fructicola]|uniref:Uncharacterized protein n=1 Tax=Monilinia fructicola TaxID=38448 RepID=A0A5M9JET7_MONFR|nr:hypothetical protein EYC84_010302 [Monilinia fructicola]